jgi:hypothetical protein
MLSPLDSESFLQILVKKPLIEAAEAIILTVLNCILSIDCIAHSPTLNCPPEIQRLCLLVQVLTKREAGSISLLYFFVYFHIVRA